MRRFWGVLSNGREKELRIGPCFDVIGSSHIYFAFNRYGSCASSWSLESLPERYGSLVRMGRRSFTGSFGFILGSQEGIPKKHQTVVDRSLHTGDTIAGGNRRSFDQQSWSCEARALLKFLHLWTHGDNSYRRYWGEIREEDQDSKGLLEDPPHSSHGYILCNPRNPYTPQNGLALI